MTPIWQWFGLLTTIVGTGLALWAALSARTAAQQAREARRAALRISQVFHLSDLLQELEDISDLLVGEEYISVAKRAMRVRGRVVRLKQDTHHSLGELVADLDLARDELEEISRLATEWTGKPENQSGRIQKEVASVYERLSKVLARQQFVGQEE